VAVVKAATNARVLIVYLMLRYLSIKDIQMDKNKVLFARGVKSLKKICVTLLKAFDFTGL